MSDTRTRPDRPLPPLPPPVMPPATRPPAPPEPAGGDSRRRHLAWLIQGGLLAVATVVWGTFNVLSLLAHEERSETETFAGSDVTAIDIASANGSVTVTGGAGDDIVVVAEISDGWRPTEVSSRIVDDVLELRASCPFFSQWCSVDFDVTVPADRPVRVDASNGSVTVREMAGPVDVDTDNGSIVLEAVSGEIRATNDNGSVTGRRLTAGVTSASTDNGRIELSYLDAPDVVSARTSNGRIEVIVPDAEVAYRVELRTDNGATDNGVRTDPSSPNVIELTTDNGSITLRPPG